MRESGHRIGEDAIDLLLDEEPQIRKIMQECFDRYREGRGPFLAGREYHDRIMTLMARTDAQVLPLIVPSIRARYLKLRADVHEQICETE